jgi:hypothetical protein
MIPSNTRILPEKIAWRYVFRGRSRVTSHIVGERVAYVIISRVTIAAPSPFTRKRAQRAMVTSTISVT